MKAKYKILIISVLVHFCLPSFGQYANTLYFLENSPYRSAINPAFMPMSRVYVGISPLAYMHVGAANSLSLKDVIYKKNDKTITAFHPDGDIDAFLKKIKIGNRYSLSTDANFNLLSFGWARQDKGYFHFNINMRAESNYGVPRDLFLMLAQGSTSDKKYDLSKMNVNAFFYTEIGGGYAHNLTEKIQIGAKIKILAGSVFVAMKQKDLDLKMSSYEWLLAGSGSLQIAGLKNLPERLEDFDDYDAKFSFAPVGYGAAIDLGATFRPFKILSVNAAITDLGFITWNKTAKKYSYDVNGTYKGIEINGLDNIKGDDIKDQLKDIYENMLTTKTAKNGFTTMPKAKINIGVDAIFWQDRVNVSAFSKTLLSNIGANEEITVGAALKPAKWFNLAVSYSFVHGGWNSLGGGITIAPYDGLQLLLAADYIPFTYAKEKNNAPIPYKTSAINASLGIVIVVGKRGDMKDKQEEEGTTIITKTIVENNQNNNALAQNGKNANQNITQTTINQTTTQDNNTQDKNKKAKEKKDTKTKDKTTKQDTKKTKWKKNEPPTHINAKQGKQNTETPTTQRDSNLNGMSDEERIQYKLNSMRY